MDAPIELQVEVVSDENSEESVPSVSTFTGNNIVIRGNTSNSYTDFYTPTTWTYTSTIYKYQLICPVCKTTNWGSIDEIVTCKGKLPNRIRGRKVVEQYCETTLKAVSKKVDFEVPIE